MRIAIISKYYKNYNFGGLLQAYALTMVLRELGHDAQQISFNPNEMRKYGIKGYLKNTFRVFARECAIRIKTRKFVGINKNMNLFMNSIPHTSIVTEETIHKLNKEYDCFVAGSDQIWNPGFSYDAYFLNFVESTKKKFSYAASIGISDLDDIQRKYFTEKLSCLDEISVREYEAKNLLEQIIMDKNIEWVLDPTMLLPAEKWLAVDCWDKMKLPNKYILVYSMAYDNSKENLIRDISHKTNLPVVRLPFTVADYSTSNQVLVGSGPKEFVTAIRHADIVLTDSFHATSFSIIHNKLFYCMQRDKIQSMNSRIDSLFRLFEIEPRWVADIEDYNKLSTMIQYDRVNEIIQEHRCTSLAFLNDALE